MSHYALIDLSEYGPHYRYECDEPEGADCRLSGDSDCLCEAWDIKRDKDGPFHMVEVGWDEATSAPIEARHSMHPVDYCNIVTWMDESDSPFGSDPQIRLRIEPRWDGDLYVVEDFTVVEPSPAVSP